jgi:hypothetical protein
LLAGGAMRRLLAIGDLHLSHKFNKEAFESLDPHPEDGLIICEYNLPLAIAPILLL